MWPFKGKYLQVRFFLFCLFKETGKFSGSTFYTASYEMYMHRTHESMCVAQSIKGTQTYKYVVCVRACWTYSTSKRQLSCGIIPLTENKSQGNSSALENFSTHSHKHLKRDASIIGLSVPAVIKDSFCDQRLYRFPPSSIISLQTY